MSSSTIFCSRIRHNCHNQSLVTNSGIVVLPVLYECTTYGAAHGVIPVPRTSKKLISVLLEYACHFRMMLRTDKDIQFFHSVMYMDVRYKNTSHRICLLSILWYNGARLNRVCYEFMHS